MRPTRSAVLVLLLTSTIAEAGAATFEARSPRHALTIELPDESDAAASEVEIRVTRLPGGEALVESRLATDWRQPVTSKNVIDDVTVFVTIHLTDERLQASLQVDQATMRIDLLNATWSLAPQPRLNLEGVLRVGGDVKAPLLISRVEAKYTEEALRKRVAGIVILEVIIDREGNVQDANVLKSLPFGLSESALDAVKQWKFRPGTLNGQPVDVLFNVTVNFRPD